MNVRLFLLAALAAAVLPAAAANKIKIVDEGKLEQWTLVPGTQLMPPYPEQYAQSPEEVCMVVGYVVNADGTTSDFALLKSWASGSNSSARTKFWSEFGDLASRALAQWRYAPKDGAAPQPVFTAATFVFGAPAAAAETREHCAVSDLTTRIVELRYDARANRRMAGGVFTRLDIDPAVEERLRQKYIAEREDLNHKRDARAEAALMKSKN